MKTYLSNILKEGGADNWQAVMTRLERVKENTTVMLPDGEFYFSDTLKINKGLRFEASGMTKLIFKQGVAGIEIENNGYVKKGYYSNFEIITHGERIGSTNGFTSHALVRLDHLFIKNFSGIGIAITADIGSQGTNASQSVVNECEVAECGSHGFYTQGGDANVICFMNCDARDNGGIGFADFSFLGCNWIGCMGHYNASGHFRAEDANNRAVFLGCYGEGGSPESIVRGAARVLGGIMGYQAGWKSESPYTSINQE